MRGSLYLGRPAIRRSILIALTIGGSDALFPSYAGVAISHFCNKDFLLLAMHATVTLCWKCCRRHRLRQPSWQRAAAHHGPPWKPAAACRAWPAARRCPTPPPSDSTRAATCTGSAPASRRTSGSTHGPPSNTFLDWPAPRLWAPLACSRPLFQVCLSDLSETAFLDLGRRNTAAAAVVKM